jgi:hypothetical protein
MIFQVILALVFLFNFSVLHLSASCSYIEKNGVRIMENQDCTETIFIEGAGWNNGIIRNNVFRNQEGYGMQVADLNRLTIENNEFYGMGNTAIKLRSTQSMGTKDVLIQKNFFHDMPATAVLTGEPNTGTKILNNKFVRVANNRYAFPNQHGIYLKGPDYLVEGNVFDGIANSNGISVRTAGVIRGNLVKNANKRGIKYYSDSKSVGSGLLVIENNVCVNNTEGGISFKEGEGIKISHAIVRFNTLVNNGSGVEIGLNMESLNVEVYGNIIVAENKDYFVFESPADLTIQNITSQSDIGFQSYISGDFKLKSASAAFRSVRGIPGLPPHDFEGNSMGKEPYNAGAFQDTSLPSSNNHYNN